MNNILVLYPRPQKVKYDYSDCNITDHLQERKPLSTLEEIEAFAAQLPDIEEVVPHFGISCLKKDGTIVIYADYGPLPKRVESSE
jgi:hypothetical protein